MGRCNWFHHTEMINFVLPKFDISIGTKQLFSYVFPEKILFMVSYSLLDSKVIWTRYLKFPLGISELPYKLRIGKETNQQNSIYASLSGRLTGSF